MPDEGALSSSFFMLSIGLERLLKVLAWLLHYEDNGKFCVSTRSFNHRLDRLFSK